MTTLDRFYSLPQRRLLNLSGQPADQVRAVIGDYHKSNTETVPWREATRFYALNHMVADIARKYTRYETLPPDLGVIVDDYIKVLCEQSRRMSTYIMMITVRESRHHNDISPSWWAKFTERFGAPVSEFLRIGGENSGGEHAILERLETPDKFPLKDVSIGLLYEAVRHLFWENSFGSSFGGPMWGRVTEPLVDMLRGKLSLEMMVDVGYTLAHNGGPIFNKGMTYTGHSSSTLREVLHFQRAGMILAGALEGKMSPGVDTDLLHQIKQFSLYLPVAKYDKTLYDKAVVDSNAQMQKIQQENSEFLSKKHALIDEPNVPEIAKAAHDVPANGQFLGAYPVWKGQTAAKYARIVPTGSIGIATHTDTIAASFKGFGTATAEAASKMEAFAKVMQGVNIMEDGDGL